MSIPRAISVILSIVLLYIGGMIHEIMAAEASNGELIEIDLDIFNGQDGAEVIDDKEVTIGAFTVANINNTDGNSSSNGAPGIDRDQATVPGEVDLMKMIIRKPSRNIAGKKLTLTLKSGSAKVYPEKTKGTEVAIPHEYTYEDIGEGVTLWVEATAPSKDVRDIAFKIVYSTADDTVNATGVWAEKTGFKNLPTDALWGNAEEPMKTDFINILSSKFGIQYAFPGNVRYAMGMEFTVSPKGIGDEPGVKFDVTRQKERSIATRKGTIISAAPNIYWAGRTIFTGDGPTGVDVDLSTDDIASSDEDNTPKSNNIYSIDAPGHLNDAAYDEVIMKINFLEFVRVRFDNITPSGNTREGSRCSVKIPWCAFIWSEKDGLHYIEKAGKGSSVTEGYIKQ